MTKSILFRTLGSLMFLGLLIEILLIVFNCSFIKDISFNFVIFQSLVLLVFQGISVLFNNESDNKNSYDTGLNIAFFALGIVALFLFIFYK